MDSDDLRSILETAGVDVWELIDSAIAVASSDYPSELKQRRDKIVEALFSSSSSSATATCNRCAQSGGGNLREREVDTNTSPVAAVAAVVERRHSPVTPVDDEFEEEDPYAGLFEDDIETRVMDIKQQLEHPDQSEDSLVELLQTLDDMDITFKALKESDIGRHVNRLRKNPSNEVKRLVKKLVRKWKEIVDEWVRLNPQGEHGSSALMADGDSPQQQRIAQNGHLHQVPDFAYSPNPNNGSSGSDRNYSEPEVVVRKPKPMVSGTPRKEAPTRPAQQHSSSIAPHNVSRQQQQRGSNDNFNSDRLASASKRLQESYKEAQNAKKQRKIQVMDIHDLPKPKNTYFAKNKGGSSQGRHW
ncbi:Probable mediator of RNA polymerase II transcription subunit 26c [Linum perenne]